MQGPPTRAPQGSAAGLTFQQFMERNRGMSIEQACQRYGVDAGRLASLSRSLLGR